MSVSTQEYVFDKKKDKDFVTYASNNEVKVKNHIGRIYNNIFNYIIDNKSTYYTYKESYILKQIYDNLPDKRGKTYDEFTQSEKRQIYEDLTKEKKEVFKTHRFDHTVHEAFLSKEKDKIYNDENIQNEFVFYENPSTDKKKLIHITDGAKKRIFNFIFNIYAYNVSFAQLNEPQKKILYDCIISNKCEEYNNLKSNLITTTNNSIDRLDKIDINDKYYLQKYLKYKAKYLELRALKQQ